MEIAKTPIPIPTHLNSDTFSLKINIEDTVHRIITPILTIGNI